MRIAPVAIILLSVAILVTLIWTLPVDPLINRFTWDDTYYYFNTALNLARGHGSTFDEINPTNGFHPLWMAVLVPIYAFAGDDRVHAVRVVLTFQAVFCLLPALWLFHRLARSWGGFASAALMTGVALILVPQRQLNGLESGLVVVLGMALLVLASEQPVLSADSSRRHRVLAGVLLGLAFLARTDNVFLIASWFIVAAACQVVEGRRAGPGAWDLRWLVPTAVPVIVIAAPYLLWNLIVFGHLMPISGALKSSLPHFAFSPWFFGTVTRGLLVIIAIGGILAAFRLFGRSVRASASRDRKDVAIVVFSAAAFLHALYTLFAMHWGVFAWHFAFYTLPFLLILVHGASTIERVLQPHALGARAFATASVLLLLLAPLEIFWKFTRFESGDFAVAGYHAGVWARDHLPAEARYGMKDAGAFGYFSERRVTNLDGVINNFRFQEYLKRGALAEYVHDQGLQFIAQPTLSNNWPEADSAGYESIVYRLPRDPQGGTFPLFERHELYRKTWGAPKSNHFVIWRIESPGPTAELEGERPVEPMTGVPPP